MRVLHATLTFEFLAVDAMFYFLHENVPSFLPSPLLVFSLGIVLNIRVIGVMIPLHVGFASLAVSHLTRLTLSLSLQGHHLFTPLSLPLMFSF